MNKKINIIYNEDYVLKRTIDIFTELHRHPELSNKEKWTTEFIKDRLNSFGINIINKNLQTGVIAEISGKEESSLVIALRADIDALPLFEKTGLEYKSLNNGCSHACGHDFHTAALLAAAEIIKENSEKLPGKVRLIFEPGEENHSGAKQMISAGVLKGVSAIFGLHNLPTIPSGVVALKSGVMMASNDNFKVKVMGVSAHAAMPQTGKDPVIAAATMVTTLQSIVSRNISPFDPVILTVGSIHGGKANNIIPNEVVFKGTIRTFSSKTRENIKNRFENVVKGTAIAYGQRTSIEWDKGPSPVNNDKIVTKIVKENAKKFMEVVPATESCADDDFATYEEKIPGCYVFMGSQGSSNLHHDDLIVNPQALRYATKLHVNVAFSMLGYLANKQEQIKSHN
jgi:amidohydrolase